MAGLGSTRSVRFRYHTIFRVVFALFEGWDASGGNSLGLHVDEDGPDLKRLLERGGSGAHRRKRPRRPMRGGGGQGPCLAKLVGGRPRYDAVSEPAQRRPGRIAGEWPAASRRWTRSSRWTMRGRAFVDASRRKAGRHRRLRLVQPVEATDPGEPAASSFRPGQGSPPRRQASHLPQRTMPRSIRSKWRDRGSLELTPESARRQA